MRLSKLSPRLSSHTRQAGQVVVEYALVLVVIITIGITVVRQLVSRDGGRDGESGAIIMIWKSVTDAIAKDPVDPPP